ncbi:hypothetical protein PTI98_013025 [Pleurotus ostreatus]|nr:hypothetical protein PTI98_013025 [Pleurotus ostreatus]
MYREPEGIVSNSMDALISCPTKSHPSKHKEHFEVKMRLERLCDMEEMETLVSRLENRMATSGRTISPMASKQPIALGGQQKYGTKLERMGVLKSAYQALVPGHPLYSAVFKIGVTRAKIYRAAHLDKKYE